MRERADNMIEKSYGSAGDRKQLDGLYAEWAWQYDQDLASIGYAVPEVATGIIGRMVPDTNAKILDGGCGTGLIGRALRRAGYAKIDGLDASAEMLEAARAKGCYQALYQILLGEEIDLPKESYDAACAFGVLTVGHAPPAALDGLLSLAKPGGMVIFSISEAGVKDGGFAEKLTEISARNAWESYCETEFFQTFPFSDLEAHVRHKVFAFRKT